jgi:hypothetical protein
MQEEKNLLRQREGWSLLGSKTVLSEGTTGRKEVLLRE